MREKEIELEIVKLLQDVFDEHNVYVKEFRKAQDWYEANKQQEFCLKLAEARTLEHGMYATPQASEVAALMIGDNLEAHEEQDIIVNHVFDGLQRISEMHPSYMPLQCPVLLPYGDDCWHINLFVTFSLGRLASELK